MKEIEYRDRLKRYEVNKNFSKIKTKQDYNEYISNLKKMNLLIILNILFVVMIVYAQIFFDNDVTKIISFVGYSISYLIAKEIYEIIKILKKREEE
ncbi:MAG: hypothetical protein QXZ13_02470 [Candidatus Diapherotrites archaeon]